MNIVKHLFALGILVSPVAAVQAADSSADSSVDASAETNVAAVDAANSAANSAVSGPVHVTFTNPDKYLDASPYRGFGGKERDEILRKLGKYMEDQGVKHLKPGQTMKIEVLDLDLAGRVEWWNASAYDVRIMRDIDSPSMKVRYSVEENGAVVASGEEWMSDHNYLMNISGRMATDKLKYEKIMLEDWFRKTLGKAHG